MSRALARTGQALQAAALLLVALTLAATWVKVIPVFRAILDGWRLSFSPASLLAFRVLPWIFPGLLLVVVAGYLGARRLQPGSGGASSLALGLGHLFLAACLLLQTVVIFDWVTKSPQGGFRFPPQAREAQVR